MGELHVVNSQGSIYSAPSLIIHYIIQHGYQPPAEFIDAVINGGPLSWRPRMVSVTTSTVPTS